MKTILRYFILLLLPIYFLGCASSRSDFTAISSKNVNTGSLKMDRAKSKGRSSGKDCQHIIIVFPTSGPPTLDEALDQALERKKGNIMYDAVAEYTTFYIPYIYGATCWRVKGDVYDSYE